MGKKSKGKKEEPPAEEAAASDGETGSRRPSTSGTENLLMTNRQTAAEQFQKATKAENAYRSKKRAAVARANFKETKNHWKEAFGHLGKAIKGSFAALRAIPYIIADKRLQSERKADIKKREKILERKKKLEEELAKEQAEGDDDGKDKA